MKTPKREASSPPVVDPSDLSDAVRERYVRSDGARKRAVNAFTNVGSPVPKKLLYRAVPEFDRLRAAARVAARRGQGSSSGAGEGSSSGAGSSSHAIVRRAPPLPEEEEVEGYDAAAFGRSLSADFVPDNAEAAVIATLCERSAEEAPELEVERRRATELNEELLRQGIAASLADPIVIASSDEE